VDRTEGARDVAPLTVQRIPNPDEPVPLFVWPTLALFGLAPSIWVSSSAFAISESWPGPLPP
jgi:hypothetical protein